MLSAMLAMLGTSIGPRTSEPLDLAFLGHAMRAEFVHVLDTAAPPDADQRSRGGSCQGKGDRRSSEGRLHQVKVFKVPGVLYSEVPTLV